YPCQHDGHRPDASQRLRFPALAQEHDEPRPCLLLRHGHGDDIVIAETFDASLVNAFANHPAIRPELAGGTEPLDLSQGVKPPNVFHFGEHGGILWTWSAPETFEAHVMLTPAGRGKWGVAAGRESIRLMSARASHL